MEIICGQRNLKNVCKLKFVITFVRTQYINNLKYEFRMKSTR